MALKYPVQFPLESPGSPRYNASYTEESPDFTEQGGG